MKFLFDFWFKITTANKCLFCVWVGGTEGVRCSVLAALRWDMTCHCGFKPFMAFLIRQIKTDYHHLA
jgi:hypothetical protein